MIYGYARVSTSGQAREGNSLTVQEEELREAGAEVIYKESFTGTKTERPMLSKLLTLVTKGDTVIVTKLDRIARSAKGGLEIIDEFLEKGVALNILNMGKFDNSPMGCLMRTVALGFAQFERDMIVQRTSEGKRIAKENNPDYKEGRPKKVIPDFQKFFEKQKGGELSIRECCTALGISKGTWYNLCRNN